MPLFPDHLQIPVSTAANADIAGDLTGRDISWMFGALWLAARTERWQSANSVILPDNPLRAELGLGHRDRVEVENARHKRLSAARIGRMPAPHLQLKQESDGTVYAQRASGAGGEGMLWIVSREAADLMKAGGESVSLPLRLLQRSDSRYTVPLALRLLAWAAGFVSRSFVQKSGDGTHNFRVPLAAFDFLDWPDTMRPSARVAKLKAAAEEIIAFSDIVVEITPRMIKTRSMPAGKLRDVDIFISVPDVTATEHKPVADTQGWRRRTITRRPSKPLRPTPADTTNVAVLPVKRGLAQLNTNRGRDLHPTSTPVGYTPRSAPMGFRPSVGFGGSDKKGDS